MEYIVLIDNWYIWASRSFLQIIDKNNVSLSLSTASDGRFKVVKLIGGANFVSLASPSPPTAGPQFDQWNYLGFTYDGVTGCVD